MNNIQIREIYIPFVVKEILEKDKAEGNKIETEQDFINFSQALFDAIVQRQDEENLILNKSIREN